MVVCLPKEKNIRPHTTPNFAFEIFLETRGRHLSCQTQHKRFLLFIFYFSRPLLSKECICKKCARRSGSGDNDARGCFVVLCVGIMRLHRHFFIRIMFFKRRAKNITTPKTCLPLLHFFRPLAGRRPSITSFMLAKKPEENPIPRSFFRPTKF